MTPDLVLSQSCHNRRHVMGSLRKRNGKWNAQIRIAGWRSFSKTFSKKTDAPKTINTKIRFKNFFISKIVHIKVLENCPTNDKKKLYYK